MLFLCRSATAQNNIPNVQTLKHGRGHPKKVIGVQDWAYNLVRNDQTSMKTPIIPMEQ